MASKAVQALDHRSDSYSGGAQRHAVYTRPHQVRRIPKGAKSIAIRAAATC